MTDTPQHIYHLQLKLWLAKSPGERLHQLMADNDALFKFWKEAKIVNKGEEKDLIIKEIAGSDSKNKTLPLNNQLTKNKVEQQSNP